MKQTPPFSLLSKTTLSLLKAGGACFITSKPNKRLKTPTMVQSPAFIHVNNHGVIGYVDTETSAAPATASRSHGPRYTQGRKYRQAGTKTKNKPTSLKLNYPAHKSKRNAQTGNPSSASTRTNFSRLLIRLICRAYRFLVTECGRELAVLVCMIKLYNAMLTPF